MICRILFHTCLLSDDTKMYRGIQGISDYQQLQTDISYMVQELVFNV